MDFATITIPTVYKKGNKKLDAEHKESFERFQDFLNKGFKITHVTSAAMSNILFVTYVLEKA